MRRHFAIAAVVAVALASAARVGAQDFCPISYGTVDDAKPNKLYLYFPTVDDTGYPQFGVGASPAHTFDAAELPSFTGTTTQLRDAVTKVVAATYCEFNVQVRQTTTTPPATFGRRSTIAIGSDSKGTCGGGDIIGQSQRVDTSDATAVDFGRVWAGTYQSCAGGAGGALNGTNSTLDRWARSIGGSAAHEAGHGYGIAHADGLVLATGEDVLVHHIMADGSNFPYSDRAGYRRHFSDREYSLLAATVGLSVQTMWNWDFINPDAGTGAKLQMDFLSVQSSIVLSWAYGGDKSPWINPTVTTLTGTETFRGTTYNKYRLEWSTGHIWSGGTAGQVAGGMPFHVGATFSSVNMSAPDAIIVRDARLIDALGAPLPLHPRIAAFDAGTFDQGAGTLMLQLFAVEDQSLQVRRLEVRQVPRLASIDSMMPGQALLDLGGYPVVPWSEGGVQPAVVNRTLERGAALSVPLARLNQAPHVTQTVTARDCDAQDQMRGSDTGICVPGVAYDLFPSTALIVTAELVDPTARHWDPATKQYVVGPVTTTVFYQVAGRRRSAAQRQGAAQPTRPAGR